MLTFRTYPAPALSGSPIPRKIEASKEMYVMSGEHPRLPSRSLAARQAYAGLRQRVSLEAGPGEGNRAAIEALRKAIDRSFYGGPSPYLQIVDDPERRADLRVKADDGRLSIYNDRGDLLVEPEDIGWPVEDDESAVNLYHSVAAAVGALESVVRFKAIAGLGSMAPRSALTGSVRLRLRRYLSQPGGVRLEELPPEATGPDGEITIYYDPSADDGNRYVVDVINESGLPIYPTIFTLSPDYSIRRLYPNNGPAVAIPPNTEEEPFSVGLEHRNERLRFWLPSGWDASRDSLMAVVSVVPCDLRFLEQRGMKAPPPTRLSAHSVDGPITPLEKLLDSIAFGEGRRFVTGPAAWDGDEWTVVACRINTLRTYQALAFTPPAAAIPLGDGLVMEKPEGFAGVVATGTLAQMTAGADGDPNLKPPPSLEAVPEVFQPLIRSKTRGGGSPVLVVAFDIDEESRRLISPENPLCLELPPLDVEVHDLLAVAWEGAAYTLVGHHNSRPGVVEITHLPALHEESGKSLPPKRGVAGAVCLFIYRRLGPLEGPAAEAYNSLLATLPA